MVPPLSSRVRPNVTRTIRVLLAIPAIGLSLPLFAAEIAVPTDVPTIQGAIDLAADGDTVVVLPGTYLETIDFLGKAITVRSSGGAEATVIILASSRPWARAMWSGVASSPSGRFGSAPRAPLLANLHPAPDSRQACLELGTLSGCWRTPDRSLPPVRLNVIGQSPG